MRLISSAISAGVLAWLAGQAAAGELEPITGVPAGENPGALAAYQYLPAAVPAAPALIVALHGCGQSAEAFAHAGWIDLAERSGSLLLLPEQQAANNPYGCWNWFLADDVADRGELVSIVNLVDRLQTRHGVDAARIFVAGLSAGGWMASVLLAAHPHLFAGGAVFAGGPAYCAVVDDAWWDPFGWWTAWRGGGAAGACMAGRDRTPAAWRARVRDNADHDGPAPPLSIWHGADDDVVDPINRRELIEQWTALAGSDVQPDGEQRLGPGGRIARRVFADPRGRTLVESYAVDGMAHGIPISAQCGTAAPFVIDVGVCAAERVGRFWGLLPDG